MPELLHIDDDIEPDVSRRGEHIVQLRVSTGKRDHVIYVQQGHGKLLLVRVLAAFRVHGGLLDDRGQSVQARVKKDFPQGGWGPPVCRASFL